MSKKLVTLITLCASLYGIAQKDTLSGKALDPIIVTANKIEQKQSTTGKVVSIISKEQIEKSSSKTVAQLLNEQVGITINGANNALGTVQTIYMRGSNSGRTLILLDGIPMNDPSMINNETDLNLFSLNDVEKIEVCRGAESTLYGSDAIAGVINIITVKKDVQNPFNAKATLSAGNLGTFKGNVQLYGKKNKLSYSARYAKLITDGFSTAYDSTGVKNFDKDGYNGNITNAQINYQATKQFSVKAFALYSQYKAGVDAGAFADKTNYDINNRNFSTGAGFQFKNDVVTVNGNYQYNQQQRKYDDNYSVPSATAYSFNEYNSNSKFAELFASIKLSKYFTLLQGGDYRFGSFNNTYKSLSSFGPYNSSFPDTANSQASLYGSLIFNIPKLNMEVGGRLNVHSLYGTNYTYTINPSFNITQQWQVFASIATGFKAPSLYQLFDAFSGNNKLNPEKAVNFQAGVQYKNHLLSARLVYFNRSIDNGIDYNYINFKYFNYIQQKVNGIEAEAAVKPTEKINLTANYTLINGTETTQNRITNKDTISYNYLLKRPKHNVNITLGYQATKGLYVAITGKYVSNRYDVGGYKKADVLLNNYFIMNAYAEYVLNKQFKVFADAQNITSKKFFDIRGYNSIPFIFNVGITFHL